MNDTPHIILPDWAVQLLAEIRALPEILIGDTLP